MAATVDAPSDREALQPVVGADAVLRSIEADEDDAAAASDASEWIHVIEEGESLSSIALLYGIEAWELAAHNGLAPAAGLLRGETLVLPVPPDRVLP